MGDYLSVATEVNGRCPEANLPTDTPPEAMEMFINVFANDGYNTGDTPFIEGARTMAECSRRCAVEEYNREIDDAAAETQRSDEELVEQWEYLRRHITLLKIERSIAGATEEDLLKVRRDFGMVLTAIRNFVERTPELK